MFRAFKNRFNLVSVLVDEAMKNKDMDRNDDSFDGVVKELNCMLAMTRMFEDEEEEFEFLYKQTLCLACEFAKWRSSISGKIQNEAAMPDEMMKGSTTRLKPFEKHSNIIEKLGQEEKKLVLMIAEAKGIENEMTMHEIVFAVQSVLKKRKTADKKQQQKEERTLGSKKRQLKET